MAKKKKNPGGPHLVPALHLGPELLLAGRRAEAIAAVPNGFIDEVMLIGPRERIRDRLQAWKESRVTTMLLHARDPEHLKEISDVLLGA